MVIVAGRLRQVKMYISYLIVAQNSGRWPHGTAGRLLQYNYRRRTDGGAKWWPLTGVAVKTGSFVHSCVSTPTSIISLGQNVGACVGTQN